MKASVILTGALLVLALSRPAHAQNATKVTEDDLRASGSWGALAGQDVVLENVKFDVAQSGAVDLLKTKGKLIVDETKDPSVATLWGKLVNYKDSKNADLAKKRDRSRSNVRVLGTARDDSQQGRVIDVRDLQKMEDDEPAFMKRGEALGSDAAALEALATEALKRANDYSEEDLRTWARKTYEKAFDAARDKAKGNPDDAVALGKKYRDLAAANNKAIDLLGPLALDASVPEKKREELRVLLDTEFAAILHRGKWMSKDDFRASLGYLSRKDAQGKPTWVRRERAEFLEEVEKKRDAYVKEPNIRHLMDGQYQAEAAKGNMIEGMAKAEVVRVRKLPGDSYYGFPDSVDRWSENVPKFRAVTWDQWVMPDGTRLYFVDGLFFLEKKKGEPLPSK